MRFILLLWFLVLPSLASGLTFETGQVIGPDGKIYDGASPQQREKLIERAKNGGDIAGVIGSNAPKEKVVSIINYFMFYC